MSDPATLNKPELLEAALISDIKEDAIKAEHVELSTYGSKISGAPAAPPISAYAQLTPKQTIRKFWRLYLWGVLCGFGGM